MQISVTQDSVAADFPPAASAVETQPPRGGLERLVAHTRISVVMPTTSYTGPFEPCARGVLASFDPAGGDDFIVVFDGEPPPPPAWLAKSGAVIVATGERSGPAVARNLAADHARGDVLLFVDADVELAADAVARVRAAFDADPDLCGVFGAYDAHPAAPGLVSRFRNLLHHHTHMQHAGLAETFWSGCGAMRAAAFADLGGFDARYREPSIEDIELGARAVAEGGRIVLDPTITCTHHKRWTLGSMIVTDVFRRAVPWTRLMLTAEKMPTRLNLDWKSRASGACAVVAAVAALVALFQPWALLVTFAGLVAIFLMNRDFYDLCARQGGLSFAAGSFMLHCLYFAYATLAFALVTIYGR
jgi:glycosyltransferase involved in cell wall biosynthesis